MRTYATSRMWETSLQNRQILENLLGNIEIFLLLKSNFPHTKFNFLQRLSAFFNGFPIFLNGFPIFLNGFPLSERSKKIHLWRQVNERSPFELLISRHSLPKLRNRHLLPSFVIATHSPSFVIATMPTSHPTHSCDAPVFPTVHQI